jgi:hypothetical protein
MFDFTRHTSVRSASQTDAFVHMTTIAIDSFAFDLLLSRFTRHSSMNKSQSIGTALFDAAVQLSVPTVTNVASVETKSRAYSTSDNASRTFDSSARRSRYSLTALVLPFSGKRSHDSVRRTSHERQQHHLRVPTDRHTGSSMFASKSDESLSASACSPTRQHRSIKTALRDIWQGLNPGESSSSTSTSGIDRKPIDERLKKVTTHRCCDRSTTSSMLIRR